MSVVSGITLQMSCSEEFIEQADGAHDIILLVVKINEWLKERGFGPLEPVEDKYGGSKHPQVLVYGGGYNYFPDDEFTAFVLSLPWERPCRLVLLVTLEEGGTRVFRPTAKIGTHQ